VTFRDTGPAASPWSAVQLTLVTSHVLAPIQSGCTLSDARTINGSSTNYVCRAANSPVLKIVLPSGTRTVTMQTANATGFGSVMLSDDGRYLAYGAYIGDFGSGHYVSTVIDLRSGATAATVPGYCLGPRGGRASLADGVSRRSPIAPEERWASPREAAGR
jgi:hypothetical protein